MVIEKLAQYNNPPPETQLKLVKAWQELGFEVVDREGKDCIIYCSGRSYSRIRVDVVSQCFDLQDGTLIQMVYSPRLTPAVSRPVNISPAGQEKVRLDIDHKMTSVLDRVGEWTPVQRQNVERPGIALVDPYFVSLRSRAKSGGGRLRVFVGLAIAVLGVIMGYLNLNAILALGSSELWLVIAVAGVFVFCLGLFNWIWSR